MFILKQGYVVRWIDLQVVEDLHSEHIQFWQSFGSTGVMQSLKPSVDRERNCFLTINFGYAI